MPYADKASQREYQRKWMRQRRAAFLDGKSCAFCAATESLEIHHFDPGAKVSHAIWSWSKPKREAELAKCIVLCHGCHVSRHKADRPTHCKRGHELTPANSYIKPRTTRRECRTCRALKRKPYVSRKAA